MSFSEFPSLPLQIQVESVLSSRYGDCRQEGGAASGGRPMDWDRRHGGADVIRDTQQRTIRLNSNAAQSPPEKGWVLVLQEGSPELGYQWTLYGFAQDQPARTDTL